MNVEKVKDRIVFEKFTGTLEFQNAEGKKFKITTIDEKTSISSCTDIYDDSSATCVGTSEKITISGDKVRIFSQGSLKVSLANDAQFIIENQSLKGRVLRNFCLAFLLTKGIGPFGPPGYYRYEK